MAQPLLLLRRGIAALVDLACILVYAGVLLGITLALTGDGIDTPGPFAGQAIGLATLTLPVVVFLALAESSGWHATPGKRLLGLEVRCASGAALDRPRALARSALRFVPWELGHLVAHHAHHAGGDEPAPWLWPAAGLSLLLPLVGIVQLIRRGETPYDRLTHTRVVRAAVGPSRSSGPRPWRSHRPRSVPATRSRCS